MTRAVQVRQDIGDCSSVLRSSAQYIPLSLDTASPNTTILPSAFNVTTATMHFPNFIKLSTCLGVIALAMLQNKAWGANAVPVVQPDPMDRSTVTAWSGQIMGKMNALGSPPSRMDVATVPLGQMRSLADRVRNELRERSGDRHLLYLGPSSRGHMYAFPLTRTEHGLRLVTGPPDRYSQMALISVSPRGHGERSIYLHDIVGAWVPNKNIMYQNLMGANAYQYGDAPVTHDLDRLLAGHIHGF